jgi:outer membrane immunogenic protein
MKKLLLATVSSLALAGMAYGADMQVAYKAAPPPPPAPTWTGFYVGIDGGVTRHDAWFNDLTGFVRFGSFASYNTAKTGGVLGGFAGYNWQDRSFVFGVEADINWIDAKAQETWGGLSVSSTTWQQSQDVPWLATFRGRVGLDFESTLVYFTGGLAVGKVENSFDHVCAIGGGGCGGVPAGGVLASFSDNTTRLGWTAGVGVEHMFASHLTLRGEVRYVDLGRSSVTCASSAATGGTVCGAGATTSYRGGFSNTLTSGLVGLGYKF